MGPLLFLLYINDIQYCSELISIVFADDTTLIYRHRCLKNLNEVIQNETNKVTDWLNANKLCVNTEKIFFNQQKIRNRIIDDFRISISNGDIKELSQKRYISRI